MKPNILLLSFVTVFILTACSPMVTMTSSKMNRLELGMSKEQVTQILGEGYTVAEKRMENGMEVEVLSFRNFPDDDEFYMFQFVDNKLEKWNRELLPKYDSKLQR